MGKIDIIDIDILLSIPCRHFLFKRDNSWIHGNRYKALNTWSKSLLPGVNFSIKGKRLVMTDCYKDRMAESGHILASPYKL